MNLNLVASSVDTTFDILCINDPSNSGQGACFYSDFTITGLFCTQYIYNTLYSYSHPHKINICNYNYHTGYVDPIQGKTNSLSISCGKYGCLNTDLNAYNLSSVDISCNGEWSCRYSDFYTQTADSTTLDCSNGERACALDVGCSGSQQDSCKITCDSTNDVCISLRVEVLGNYDYGYLDFSSGCIANNNTCTSVTFRCDYGAPGKETATYNYNSDYGDFICDNDDASYCCPHAPITPSPTDNSTTDSPTTDTPTTDTPTTDIPTTAIPTENPTTVDGDGSSNPTATSPTNDTLNPTQTPTTICPWCGKSYGNRLGVGIMGMIVTVLVFGLFV